MNHYDSKYFSFAYEINRKRAPKIGVDSTTQYYLLHWIIVDPSNFFGKLQISRLISNNPN